MSSSSGSKGSKDPALLSIPDLEGQRKMLIEQLKKNAVKALGAFALLADRQNMWCCALRRE
jgi:hypothetical protein